MKKYIRTAILLLLVFFVWGSLAASDHPHYTFPAGADLLLEREVFALGYSYKHRQAVWVCYVLTRENLLKEQVKRLNKFQSDPEITYDPVRPEDYRKTGYDRGHLAPAADMTYTFNTMLQSFFMSNISPQLPGCNRGIWKRIENQVRKWALKEGSLYIITGPIFNGGEKTLGQTDIPIPTAFYKVVLDLTPPVKMVAFIAPNYGTKKRVHSFVTTVDEVEKITGFDFFSDLDDTLEVRLEKESDFSAW